MDVQKRFLIYRMYPKIFGGPSLRLGVTKECPTSLQVLDEVGMTLVDW